MNVADLNFYSFFTQYSLMEEYGFTSGLFHRLLRKVLPQVPDSDTVEFVLLDQENPVPLLLSRLDLKTVATSPIAQQLDLSIQALCAKVVAFGLDNHIKAKYNSIELDSKPFETLLARVNTLPGCPREDTEALIANLKAIEGLVINLRKNKNKIGTNFHLTLTTRRILEYTQRVRALLALKLNISSPKHWETLFREFIDYAKGKNSIRRYLKRHADLVALEIVEHTAGKGEKYIAENRAEYWSFFRRSLLGGGIIALFAFFKLFIDSFRLTEVGNAFFFSLNYALCFILVKQVGGIIATKQPAMTASTIAKNIDSQDDLRIDSLSCITDLVRKVFRSQFISVIGNFLMALTLAALAMFLLQQFGLDQLTEMVQPKYLIDKIVPTGTLVFFAAIAGVFLALSGVISGYVDNKVVAAKIGHRIRNNPLFLRSNRLAAFAEQKAGSLFGNLCLGFFLGSAFLLSNLVPFPVDIRHIAFSSAYVGYSVVKYDFAANTVLLALFGALLIGFVNFIVSFSITLYLALRSRRASFRLIPQIVLDVAKDFLRHPLHYFGRMDEENQGASARP